MKKWKKQKKSLTTVNPFKIDWWHDTNDPKTWSPYVSTPKSTAAQMADAQDFWGPSLKLNTEMWLAYKKKLEHQMLYGSSAYAQGSALSASAGTNYVQVWAPPHGYMTYEKAVALNNGD